MADTMTVEIAHSLLRETAPAWASEVLRETLSSPSSKDLGDVQDACYRCLALLGDTMSLCLALSEENRVIQKSPPERRPDRWAELLTSVQAWYESRPSDLHPLVDQPGSVFPAVLFSSGAAMVGNTMYHTAMYLLLSFQQQEAPDSYEQAKSGLTAPVWHMRQICGIIVSGKGQHTDCWDPCMIGAFTFAARRTTDQTEQKELRDCLDSISAAGWRLGSLRDSFDSKFAL